MNLTGNAITGTLDAAGNVIAKTGDALDKNITTDEEQYKQENIFSQQAQLQSTERLRLDNASDSWMARNARPFGFLLTLGTFLIVFWWTAIKVLVYTIGDHDSVSPADMEMIRFHSVLLAESFRILFFILSGMVGFYYVSRLLEKRARIKAGILDTPSKGMFNSVKEFFFGPPNTGVKK